MIGRIGKAIASAAFWVALGGHALGAAPDVLAPDMILHNGKIVTVDGTFSVVQAVAIKDGRFLAVGSNDAVLPLAGTRTEKVDLKGRTVLPGLYDSHLHLAWPVGQAPDPLIAKLGAARSIADVLQVVKEKLASTPPGKVVMIPDGPALVTQLAEKRWPTRQDLDPVSPHHPLVLTFAADGVYAANSQALAKAGITKATAQPQARGLFGEFLKDPKTGELTGVMTGRSAAHILREGLGIWSVDELEANIARSIPADVIPYGITSFADPAMSPNNQPIQLAYQRVLQRSEGRMARVNLMIRLPARSLSLEDNVNLIQGLLYSPPFRSDFFRVGTFKISLDKGYPGAKPYIVPAEKGKKILIEGHKAGWQLYIHATTPETFDYACEALEEAQKLYPRQDARHILTHVPYPTRKNLETMKRLGVVADLQVASIYHMADDAEKNIRNDPARPALGPKPVATYRDAGIPVILSSDQAPVGPLFSIWEAVNRVRKSGKVFQPEERLTLQEAIRGTTQLAAWSFFEDDVKGSIQPGKYADLVVLGRDILTIDPIEIKDIPVLMTMTAGKFVYVNPSQEPRQKVPYLRYPSRVSFLDGADGH